MWNGFSLFFFYHKIVALCLFFSLVFAPVTIDECGIFMCRILNTDLCLIIHFAQHENIWKWKIGFALERVFNYQDLKQT